MALGDERRASGRRMEAERKAIGAAMRAARQSTFKRDLNALETPPRRSGGLSAAESVGSRQEVMGKSYYTEPPAGGGGMASPLTETGTREYHPAVLVTSSDGIFTLQVEHIKKLIMQDANGDSHTFNYLEPDLP